MPLLLRCFSPLARFGTSPRTFIPVITTLILLAATPAILAAADSPRARIDPRLHSLISRLQDAGGVAASARPDLNTTAAPGLELAGDGTATVSCIMDLSDAGFRRLEDLGIVPRTRVGDLGTFSVPVAILEEIESLPGLRAVEMARELKPLLDVSRVETMTLPVHGAAAPPYPSSGFTGRGVVVGIVDTGVDLQHNDFLNDTTGLTRIGFLWDQTVGGAGPQPYGYGREWTAAAINAGQSTERDTEGHGTHVLGIAAGDGSVPDGAQTVYPYVGIAPEADIIVVKSTFSTSSVVDAVEYIFSKAGSRDAVINLSLGTQDGPHDGTSLFDRMISALNGPGRIIVAAAGNQGDPNDSPSVPNLHARLTLDASKDSVVFTFTIPPYTPNPGTIPLNDYLVLDGWYDVGNDISFVVQSPTGKRSPEVTIGNSRTACLSGDGRVYLENSDTFVAPANGDHEIYVEITEPVVGFNCGTPRVGTWKITAFRRGALTNGHVDFWVGAARLGPVAQPSFVSGASNDYLVASPASAQGVVSVGATISKRQWISVAGPRQYVGFTDADLGRIAPFSSPGPLRDETPAPDVVAPGMGIASARSGSAAISSSFALPDGAHTISQGTSQSAPHVAGAVALMLEQTPHLTPAQVIDRLTSTARQDAFTGMTPNKDYGYGKLNVLEAIGGLCALYEPCVDVAFEAADDTACAGDSATFVAAVTNCSDRSANLHVVCSVDDVVISLVDFAGVPGGESRSHSFHFSSFEPGSRHVVCRGTATNPEMCSVEDEASVLVDFKACAPGGCWLTGSGCVDDGAKGSDRHAFHGSVGSGGGGSWDHVVRTGFGKAQARAVFKSRDARTVSCFPDDAPEACGSPSGINTAVVEGTGFWSPDNGPDVRAFFTARVRDHGEAHDCPPDRYAITITDSTGAVLLRVPDSGDAAMTCGNLQIHDRDPGAGSPERSLEIAGADADRLRLGPAVPNPFQSSTRLLLLSGSFSPGVEAAVFNVAGRRVRSLVTAQFAEGVEWDGRDDAGRSVPGGMYFIRVADGSREELRRVLFLNSSR